MLLYLVNSRAYDAAYTSAISLCEEMDDSHHKSILEEITVGLRKELESHIKNSKSSTDEYIPKKATLEYTKLLRKASQSGNLANIASSICPCNKLCQIQ